VKHLLLMGGERSLNQALNEALMAKSVKTEARPSERLREVRAGAPMETLPPVTKHKRTG
jgi:hypothetical protein